ncbi:MAG: amino acid ABC transporter permease [Clostridia bacterium]|nr:amino acid ABC transporter permease [Clostridia bacterium]
MSFEVIIESLFRGFGMTVAIFFATLVIALPLGLIFSFLQNSKIKVISWLMNSFIWVVRGTPLMLQLMIIYYGPGLLFDVRLRDFEFAATLIAFSINYACYFSVIFKGGMNAVAKGQYEACQVLGMKKSQAFVNVAMPQIYKNILPPMSNEIITLVKDTSLAKVVALPEIIHVANNIRSLTASVLPLFGTAIFYLVFVGILSVLFAKLEKRTNRYR